MATANLYFENEIALVAEHPDGYALFTYLPAPRTPTQLLDVMTHLANLLQRRGWHRVLNDQRQMQPFSAEETALASSFWDERTHDWGHGLCIASILASDVFARLAATSMRQQLRSANLGYHLFDGHLEAEAWLRTQEQVPALK